MKVCLTNILTLLWKNIEGCINMFVLLLMTLKKS